VLEVCTAIQDGVKISCPGTYVHSRFLKTGFVPGNIVLFRLGEFSPIVQLFSLGSFLKITEVAQIFGDFFSTEKDMCQL
jgi:hypothetical protein